MIGLFLCSFLLLGQGSTQLIIGKGLNKAHTKVEGVNKILKIVVAEDEMNRNGLVVRESIPLTSPRPDYAITPNDVRFYLKHSLVSTCTNNYLESNKCFCEGKFKHAKIFRNETLDSQAFVAADPLNKLIVVSYRMSSGEKNWDSNNRFTLIPYPGLTGQETVHRGHYEYISSIHSAMAPDVLAMFKNPEYKDYKLHVTGYSFGGSIAAVSLPMWINAMKGNNLTNKAQLYSYSSPRPGNIEFAKYLEGLGVPLVRYTKRGDVIPHIPDQSAGFSHSGLEFYDDNSLPILKKGLIKCDVNVMEDKQCSLKDTNFLAKNHETPFQALLPISPYC